MYVYILSTTCSALMGSMAMALAAVSQASQVLHATSAQIHPSMEKNATKVMSALR